MIGVDVEICPKKIADWVNRDIGAAAYCPQPIRLVALFLNLTVNIGLLFILINSNNGLFKFILAIAYGLNWTITGLFAHELIHGYIVSSRNWQKLLALPCMYYSMLAPSFWSHWHMIHHRFGTLDENVSGFQTINWARARWIKRIVLKIRPSGRGAGEFLYLFFWKSVATIINQLFYFVKPRFKKKISRTRMAIELILIVGAHSVAWHYLSRKQILFIEVIPWCAQNFFASALVVTNHHPLLISSNVGVNNSCSVSLGSKILDHYFLNSGYHVEHHLAPNLSPKYLPVLSRHLIDSSEGRYTPISIFEAHKTIFFSRHGQPDSNELN